jgi:hypothetical protein
VTCPDCTDGRIATGPRIGPCETATSERCETCGGRSEVADTAGVKLCRAYYDFEPDAQGTSADLVYADEREYWDRLADAAGKVFP